LTYSIVLFALYFIYLKSSVQLHLETKDYYIILKMKKPSVANDVNKTPQLAVNNVRENDLSPEVSGFVASLLQASKDNISAGEPSKALENVIQAIRLTHGEDAILHLIDAAKAASRRDIDKQIAAQTEQELIRQAMEASQRLAEPSSLLADMGDGSEVILQQAFQDGSSVICAQCGGLVPRVRWEIHRDMWCPHITSKSSDNSDDDGGGGGGEDEVSS
jgi:hypothetical protein